MPRPLNPAPSPGQELRNFTNREKEFSVLKRMLALPPGTPLPVVVFYGVGGAGKSWLARRLRSELPQFTPSALLDLDPSLGGASYHTDSSRALASLRDQFRDTPCSRFDVAYAWLRHKEGVNDEPFLKGDGPAGALVEALGDLVGGALDGIPLVGFITKKLAGKLKKHAKNTLLERWLAESTGQADFLKLRRMSPQEIYPELGRRLLQDLSAELVEWVGHSCRGVVFLDTFEKLREGAPGEAQGHEREAWVRELVASDAPLLLVVTGRDRLRWSECDPDFASDQFMEQHLVGGLSASDARRFLGKCGIADTALQDAVLAATIDTETESRAGEERGHHPYSLGLAADAVVNEQSRGVTVDPATFDLLPGDHARLAQRFLKSLADPAHQIWVRRLALTPRFDEAAARLAHSDGRSVEQEAAWQALRRYSFLRDTDEEGYFALHAQMRESLSETATDAVAENQFWQAYWRSRSSGDCDEHASWAWYHSYRLAPVASLADWSRLARGEREAGRMAVHLRLLQWWDLIGVLAATSPTLSEAGVLSDLAFELTQASLGDRGENLRRAIDCYTAALNAYTEADFPQDWAITQNNLGNVFAELPTGERVNNLRRAIKCYTSALLVRTQGNFPLDWATTQNNLGSAYADLPTGDRGENLRRAIDCYTAALLVHTEANFPQEWALAQNNLGTAHATLPTGDRGENLRRAIDCYTAALRVRTQDNFPRDWATTQHNLGHAHAALPTDDEGENLRLAIDCYTAALLVHTEANFAQEWATSHNNLGLAYAALLIGDPESNLRRAIECYMAALRVRTPTNSPRDWAKTQNNLGSAHTMLMTGDLAENLRRAIDCYMAALLVHTEVDFPQDWATTQKDLGFAYRELFALKGSELDRTRAIDCFKSAARGFAACGCEFDAADARQLANDLGPDATGV